MSFDDIISNIRERAEILKSQGMNAQKTPEDSKAKVASMQAHGEQTPMNKVVQNSPTKEQPPLPKRPTCSFCRNQHLSLKCPTFLEMTRDERVKAIKDGYLCFRCLSPDHISKFCPCPRPRCGSCSGPHQTFLHYDEGEYTPAYTSAHTLSPEVRIENTRISQQSFLTLPSQNHHFYTLWAKNLWLFPDSSRGKLHSRHLLFYNQLIGSQNLLHISKKGQKCTISISRFAFFQPSFLHPLS